MSNKEEAYSKLNELVRKCIDTLIENENQVNIYLVNGIKLTGIIENFEDGIILINSKDSKKLIIYTHAISTIEH